MNYNMSDNDPFKLDIRILEQEVTPYDQGPQTYTITCPSAIKCVETQICG